MLYDAWGLQRSSTGSGHGKYRFAGAEFDSAAGLYHMGARFYDPSLGRWLSEDPVQDQLFDPLSLNYYAYAAGNPVLLIDPDGESTQQLVLSLGIASLGLIPGLGQVLAVGLVLTGLGLGIGFAMTSDRYNELWQRAEKAKQAAWRSYWDIFNRDPGFLWISLTLSFAKRRLECGRRIVMDGSANQETVDRLLAAIGRNDTSEVMRLASVNPRLLVELNEPGQTAMTAASKLGRRELTERLCLILLEAIRGDRIPIADLPQALRELGAAGFHEAEKDIARHLGSSDADVKHAAITVLTFEWDTKQWQEQLMDILEHDYDSMVRGVAVRGLGFILRESRNPQVARVLLRKIRDGSESSEVRWSSFEALRTLWMPSHQLVDLERRDLKRDIDRLLEITAGVDPARAESLADTKVALERWDYDSVSEIDWRFIEQVEQSLPS